MPMKEGTPQPECPHGTTEFELNLPEGISVWRVCGGDSRCIALTKHAGREGPAAMVIPTQMQHGDRFCVLDEFLVTPEPTALPILTSTPAPTPNPFSLLTTETPFCTPIATITPTDTPPQIPPPAVDCLAVECTSIIVLLAAIVTYFFNSKYR